MIKVRFTNRMLEVFAAPGQCRGALKVKTRNLCRLLPSGARSSARSLLCSKEQRSLRERQAHSQSRERPDGRRFESGRAHQSRRELPEARELGATFELVSDHVHEDFGKGLYGLVVSAWDKDVGLAYGQ